MYKYLLIVALTVSFCLTAPVVEKKKVPEGLEENADHENMDDQDVKKYLYVIYYVGTVSNRVFLRNEKLLGQVLGLERLCMGVNGFPDTTLSFPFRNRDPQKLHGSYLNIRIRTLFFYLLSKNELSS